MRRTTFVADGVSLSAPAPLPDITLQPGIIAFPVASIADHIYSSEAIVALSNAEDYTSQNWTHGGYKKIQQVSSVRQQRAMILLMQSHAYSAYHGFFGLEVIYLFGG